MLIRKNANKAKNTRNERKVFNTQQSDEFDEWVGTCCS